MTYMQATLQRTPMALLKLFFLFPLLGQMVMDLRRNDDQTLIYFGLNIAMLWLLAGFIWGLVGVLAGAYFLLPFCFIALLVMTRV